MAVFEHQTFLPHPREEVFAWFERPGALHRLTPPFSGRVLSAPSDGIRPGSTAVIAIGAPGVAGTGLAAAAAALAARVPWTPRPEVAWTARHTAYEKGRLFRDEMVRGPLGHWVHTHLFEDAPGGTLMRDTIDYGVPAERFFPGSTAESAARLFASHLRRIFAYRADQLAADLAFHAAHTGLHPAGRPLAVAISGASGLIGTQLRALLEGGGHRVLPLVRRAPAAPGEIFWGPATGTLDPEDLAACDAVVNLAGSPIGRRFTPAVKEDILRSRLSGTDLLARTAARLAGGGAMRTFVSASATGYYGAHPHREPDPEPLREDAPAGDDFLAAVCSAWEAAAAPAESAGVRTVRMRTGLVQSSAGGVLAQLLPLYAAGLGGPVRLPGSGEDPWQSWISLEDTVGAYAHAVLGDPAAEGAAEGALEGPVNLVAPEPVPGSVYARTLGRALHRPAALRVPAAAPRLLLGREGAADLAFSSQRVSSSRLEASGYVFRHRRLEDALRHVLP
ncbi:hypothetical protein NCCP1664_21680 [Zafaria cholistanensis]|uniref:TIGR01777 family protein n=1 Tax=Zafaria cholistanensis TaxID=1682741 RepID=A0A5A7NS62_9MICC|nr:TIGR01777 family oxidoreductase [Zafaria cholistanensis]GER23673.1 hypothetical protein NCCP1664_21680 [Zafaria cholistanensis]